MLKPCSVKSIGIPIEEVVVFNKSEKKDEEKKMYKGEIKC